MSMTLMATLKIDDKDPVVRAKAASGAKVQIGKSGKFCGQSAVQMHGGMGVTDELAVSHYFKRYLFSVLKIDFKIADFFVCDIFE